jgi:hypothetical protein
MTSRLRDLRAIGVWPGGSHRPAGTPRPAHDAGHTHRVEHGHDVGHDHGHSHDHGHDVEHDHGHSHGHGHDHGHSHDGDAGFDNGHAPGANPLLDIGGDVGAVIVYLARQTRTGEIEARPPGRDDARFHTGVHPRELGGELVPVALFPQVTAGEYELLGDDGQPVARMIVTGGQVSEVDLRRR